MRKADEFGGTQRNLPARGFRPGTMLLGVGLVMGYGWYHLIKGIREAKCVFFFFFFSEHPMRRSTTKARHQRWRHKTVE